MSPPSSDRPAPSTVWDAADYDSCGAFVWEYGASLIELLGPRSGERVLDVGCGTGHLTAKIAEAGAYTLGIDASESMVQRGLGQLPAPGLPGA